MDYGADLVAHFLYSELQAEGHLTQVDRGQWVYRSGDHDYQVTIRAKKIKTRKRLTEEGE